MEIKISGIKRNSSLLKNQDGACTELINMRFINGEWQSIQPHITAYNFFNSAATGKAGIIYDHKFTPDNRLIWWDEISLYDVTLAVGATGTNDSKMLIKAITGVLNITEFGKLLIVVCTDNVYYFKFADNGYSELKNIEHGRYRFGSTEEELFGSEFTPVSAVDYRHEGISALLARKNNLEKMGKFNGHIFFKLAFKTFDGNYVLHSPVFYRYIGYHEYTNGIMNPEVLPNVRRINTSSAIYRFDWGYWGKPTFYLYFNKEQIDTLKNYDGMIESLCLFIREPHLDFEHNIENDDSLEYYSGVDINNTPIDYNFFPHAQSIDKYFDSNNSFYLADTIPIKKLDEITVTAEPFVFGTDGFDVILKNQNLYENTVTVKSVDGLTTYIENTDYVINYLGGTLNGVKTSIIDESFTTGTALDIAIPLAHKRIDSTVFPVVTSANGLTTFKKYVDYSIDYANGTITALSGGGMAVSTSYLIDYTYITGLLDAVSYQISYRHYLKFTLDLGDIGTIPTKKALPTDQFTAHRFFSDVNYEYNSRVHYGNVKTKLGNPPNLTVYDPNSQSHLPDGYTMVSDSDTSLKVGTTPVTLYALVTLNTTDGDKNILVRWDKIGYSYNSIGKLNAVCLNQVYIYPDQRAVNLKFLWYDGTNYINTGHDDIKLKASDFGNYAYGIPKVTEVNVSYGSYTGSLRILKYNMLTTFSFGYYTLPTLDDVLNDTNRVQVSELNNILLFNARNSYRIGHLSNKIIGITTQATPVSTGQFGQFPLYVFSTEGIFVLSSGVNVLYDSIKPISLQSCNNKKSIIQVEGGIVFSTQYGLWIIVGSMVKELSIPVEGVVDTYINNDTAFSTDIIQSGLALSTQKFKDFLDSAELAYDRVYNEIVISQPLLNNYRFNLLTGEWYREDFICSMYFTRGSKLYASVGARIYSLTDPDDTTSTQSLVITRPLKLGSHRLKTIKRIALRTEGITSASFFLYGSLNKIEWKLIQGKIINSSSGKEVMLEITRTTARYFIFYIRIQGVMTRLGDIDVDFEEVAGNKVR